jgi:type 2 lantibiotic biosynthesis protein LanM
MTFAWPDAALPARATLRGNRVDDADLRQVAAGAAPLFDRIGGPYEPVPGGEAAARRNLAAWRDTLARGDEAFARRLAWDGLTEDAVLPALGPVRLRDGIALPAWAEDLRAILAAADGFESSESPPWAGDELAIPFVDALAPFVASAADAVRARTSVACFGPGAWGTLERALLHRLFTITAHTLQPEFNVFRHGRLSALDRLFQATTGNIRSDVYEEFVADLLAGGWRRTVLEYPVLGRLIATLWRQWVDSTVEMAERLAADAPLLADELGAAGIVDQLRASLSDAHRGGRMVAMLTFASGVRVVYKPRPVSGERVWERIVRAFEDVAPEGRMRPAHVVDRGGYGWMECLDARPVATEAEAGAYHERLGVILALTYALGTNDCHYENLVAAGAFPALVDLETLMHPVHASPVDGIDFKMSLAESVLRTGLLPFWMKSDDGKAYDISAVGAVEAQPARQAAPNWKHTNTDLMALEFITVRLSPGQNVPRLDGRALTPEAYAGAVARGFHAGYAAAQERLPALLAADGALGEIRRLRLRLLLRPTFGYALALQGATEPDALRDAVVRSVRIDAMAQPFVEEPERPAGWALLRAERAALEQQDCPHFVAHVGSNLVETEFGPAGGIVAASCLDDLDARLARLSEKDRRRQAGIVLAALDSRGVADEHASLPALERRPADAAPSSTDANEVLLDAAVRIGAEIMDAAVPGPRGAPYWLCLHRVASLGKLRVEAVNLDLFEGRAGIAYFLAALSNVTGDPAPREMVRNLYRPLEEEARLLLPAPARAGMLLNGITGLAGLLYGVPAAAELLGEPDAARGTAEAVLDWMGPDRIHLEHAPDLFGGHAGSIVSLLHAHRVLGMDRALEYAAARGDHLLATRTSVDDGLRSWAGEDGTMLTGLSHGAAGIALALLRLSAATGDAKYRDGALEAVEWENARFDADAGNWPDLRGVEGIPAFADAWCHGAPGIAVSRIVAMQQGMDARRDVDAGVRVARQAQMGAVDHVCCGNLGRALLLFEAGRALDDAALQAEGRARAADVVARADARGGYGLWRRYDGFLAFPGLFQGLAGIGHALLRLSGPDRVPSLLMLD